MSNSFDIPSFVRILVRDDAGRFLCLKDRDGRWNVPGGKIEKGESPMEAAARELFEETTVVLEQGEILASDRLIFSGVAWNAHLIIAKNISGRPQIGEPEKFSAIAFHPIIIIAQDQIPEYAELLIRASTQIENPIESSKTSIPTAVPAYPPSTAHPCLPQYRSATSHNHE